MAAKRLENRPHQGVKWIVMNDITLIGSTQLDSFRSGVGRHRMVRDTSGDEIHSTTRETKLIQLRADKRWQSRHIRDLFFLCRLPRFQGSLDASLHEP